MRRHHSERSDNIRGIIRRRQLLTAALVLAERIGSPSLTRANVAREAGVTAQAISFYFTSSELRDLVMSEALRVGCLRVIAQGVILRHPATTSLSLSQQRTALLSPIEE